MDHTDRKRVLILCTGNSCRSQIAESLWRAHAGDRWEVFSAGSRPAGYVHPLAVAVMIELGIDISPQVSKHVDSFADQAFDLVVTVCDGARQACPVFAKAVASLHWPIMDPVLVEGSSETRMQIFREVRDQIKHRIEEHLLGAPSMGHSI